MNYYKRAIFHSPKHLKILHFFDVHEEKRGRGLKNLLTILQMDFVDSFEERRDWVLDFSYCGHPQNLFFIYFFIYFFMFFLCNNHKLVIFIYLIFTYFIIFFNSWSLSKTTFPLGITHEYNSNKQFVADTRSLRPRVQHTASSTIVGWVWADARSRLMIHVIWFK